VVVDKRVTLIGYDWPVVDGGGEGTVVKLVAPGVVVRGFVIRNSGDSLDAENSGIAVEAPEAVVENNRLEGTLFGIYLRKAPHSVIRDNVIHSKDLALPRRGDAIRVWYSNGVRIEDNVVAKGRDVVLWYSENLTVRGNVVTEGRYGLHFMYCDDALIEGNRLTRNSVGAFLMYSRRLHLRRNLIAYNRGPSGYGVGLKDMDDAVIEENLFLDNRVGAFLDNSPREIESIGVFRGNVFAFNDIGVTLLPSVRRNQFTGNSFVDNQEQVHVAGGGQLLQNLWTVDGVGNYWSDYVGYDGDGDGVGDVPYRAERLFENLMDRHPSLRLFLYSPAAQAVDFAARAFPFVKPQPKLVDTQPLMTPRIPAGLPAMPQPRGWPLGVTSLGLLALAAILGLFPRLRLGEKAGAPVQPGHGGECMVHVRDLTKRFGSVVAVDHLSFDANAGEAVALWGPNGAGKTTALRCLLGLLPYEGTVRVADYEVSLQGKAARRLIGFVPQELNFHDDLTVRETLHFHARLKKAPADAIAAVLERLDLAEHAHKPVRDLSGGMKQRLALAVALLADPPLLVLDEPTTNLDARAREDFLALLAELKAAGKTLIFASHRLEEVMGLADRILVLERGKLVAAGTPEELSARLGWQATLRLHVPADRIEPALTTLADHGFRASRNGKDVRVQVAPGEKGRPIGVLIQAGIPVHDFEVEPPRTNSPEGEEA
jgi:nitrous oxidase accessory protein